MDELREVVARVEAGGPTYGLRESEPKAYILHLHRRYAAPLSSTLFALVGVPLGMRRTRGARSFGVLLSAGVAFLYYAIQSLAEYLALSDWLAPAVAPWVPNLVFVALAALLLMRARHVQA
jgi:lipopolysaccharide export LptBFGC system permease protein LptF